MKRLVTLIALIFALNIYTESILRDWQSYTNTTHISNITVDGDHLLLATWGGVLEYDITEGSFGVPIKKLDGLTENEISSISVMENGEILIGTKGGGINRLHEGEFLMPLNETSGAESDNVYAIESYNNRFAAITDEGISVFSELPVWPLPSVRNYTEADGLSSSILTCMAINQAGILYCGSDNGIDYADLNDDELVWQHLNRTNTEIRSDHITGISINEVGMAISTRDGIYFSADYQDNSNWIELGSSGAYFPVYLDDAGKVWSSRGYWDEAELSVLESDENMLICFDIQGNETIWTQDDIGSVNSMVTSIKEIETGIVISTWGEGIFIYDGTSWSESLKEDCIGVNFTTTLQLDSRSRLWVGNGTLSKPDHRRANRGVSVLDGSNWQTFRSDNSGLVSNNINSIVELENDVFWFTSYTNDSSNYSGLNVLDYSDPVSPVWDFYQYMFYGYDIDPLPTGNVGSTFIGNDGNVWLCCYNGGVTIRDSYYQEVAKVIPPHLYYSNLPNTIHAFQGDHYIVIGGWLTGFEIFPGNGIPEPEDSLSWIQPNNSDFTNGHVYDAIERETMFDNEVWIASSLALYMYDGEDWFRYGKESTKRQYLSGNNEWEPTELEEGINDSPDWWYFEGQERLYGGANTYPTALLVDPFNNLWIGTDNNGICRYDIENNKFKTWNTNNSPLLDNQINDLEYDESTGTLYIATLKGLNSVFIGFVPADSPEDKLDDVTAFPNPFSPEKDNLVRIEVINQEAMPKGISSCYLYNLNGHLVRELELNNFVQFEWDGTNAGGKKCSSGIYFYVLTGNDGTTRRGKIVLVR